MPPELDMTTSHVPSHPPTHDHIQKEETVRLQSPNLLELVLAGRLANRAQISHKSLFHLVLRTLCRLSKCIYSVKIGCASVPYGFL